MKNKMSKGRKSPRRSSSPASIYELLGFERIEAAALERKSELYTKVLALTKESRLTQKKLAALLGISQPHVSQLLNGKISRFSVEKLIEFAERLGAEVKIIVHKKAS